MARPAQLTIDTEALRSNCQLVNQFTPQSKNMAIVKANAYGHGALAIATAIEDLVPAFGVACIEEALALRASGIVKPILLLEGAFQQDEICLAAEQGFWLAITDERQLNTILSAQPSCPLTVWIGLDTGMHRLGISPAQTTTVFSQCQSCPHIGDIVLCTHFACADNPDNPFTQQQLSLFMSSVGTLSAPFSFANSAALLAWPTTHAQWNRPGLILYGCSPFSGDVKLPSSESTNVLSALQPVMSVTSAVIALRTVKKGETVGYGGRWSAPSTRQIATVAIGYGDGYPVNAPDGTPVWINGQVCQLAGRVSMDMITVDVTSLGENVHIGDEVELWGKRLSVDAVARSTGILNYELLTRMPERARQS